MTPTFHDTGLAGVVLVEPVVHRDDRGFFLETFHAEKYAGGGVPAGGERFVQDNHSRSVRATLRGLHAQTRRPQGKLVRAVEGAIWDVAVDIRRGSPTFGLWVGYTLSADNFHQLYVPPGFLHGFCVLTDTAQVEYKCTDLYDPGHELGVAWNDPDLAIEWPIDDPILSAKDAAAPQLRELEAELPLYREADVATTDGGGA
ncbi:MAG: dTDP-4-dehydrorhamnose 3,5-epimerase [Acidobacteriota bacterium]